MNKKDLSKYIDHTLLKADAVHRDIKRLCDEAVKYGFAAVCVSPSWVRFCKEHLGRNKTKVCTVIGFPLGYATTETKVFEAADAVKNGADELDLVINIGKVRSGGHLYQEKEIRKVRKACKGKILKIILETSALNRKEIILLCKIAKKCSADYVKTSTGFGLCGAKVSDVRLMRKTVGNKMGVKASGGIKTYEEAIKMIKAGASRIGTSSSINIVSAG